MIKKTITSNDLIFAYRLPHGEHYLTDLHDVAKMREANINTICFFAANTYSRVGVPYSPYPMIWEYEYEYNFEPLDRQIADIVALNPKAALVCIVDLNSPLWLARLLRRDSYDELGNCAVNPRWRELTFAYLRRFLLYSEEHHHDRIIAYVLACGKTAEWFDMRPEGDDFKEEAFLAWCDKQGLPRPEHIPSRRSRSGAATHGHIRDPQTDADAIAYWRFSNETISSLANDMIAEARRNIREEAQLGMFISAGLSPGDAVETGRNDFLRVFDTNGMNFSITAGAPIARLGIEGYGFLDPQLSLHRRNMHHLVEIDQRTHTSNRKASQYVTLPTMYSQGWQTEELTIAGLKREMALCMIHRASLWFFNIFGGAYQGEKIWETFTLMKQVWDDNIRVATRECAEVLLVVDPESNYYILERPDAGVDGATRLNFLEIRNCLNLTGVPYQSCCFDDLDAVVELSRYKLVIFANLVSLTDERIRILREKILTGGRTVLWQYAPGIIFNNEYNPDHVEQLCGSPFALRDLQVKAYPDWTSVYAYNLDALTPGTLRKIMREALVHLYVPEAIGIQARPPFLMVHDANTRGKIRINLPVRAKQITELFSGRITARDTAAWEENFDSPDTRLYYIEE